MEERDIIFYEIDRSTVWSPDPTSKYHYFEATRWMKFYYHVYENYILLFSSLNGMHHNNIVDIRKLSSLDQFYYYYKLCNIKSIWDWNDLLYSFHVTYTSIFIKFIRRSIFITAIENENSKILFNATPGMLVKAFKLEEKKFRKSVKMSHSLTSYCLKHLKIKLKGHNFMIFIKGMNYHTAKALYAVKQEFANFKKNFPWISISPIIRNDRKLKFRKLTAIKKNINREILREMI